MIRHGAFARFVVAGTIVLLAVSAQAQTRPAPVAEFAAGWVGFADDGIVSEGLVGGAARVYVSPRVSVGPEIVHIQGGNHSHLVVTGNITWDVRSRASGGPRKIMPFLVAGGGLYRTRERFPTGPYTSSEAAFTVGGGVRVLVSDRVTTGVDVRMGWEPHIRVNAIVGVRLAR